MESWSIFTNGNQGIEKAECKMCGVAGIVQLKPGNVADPMDPARVRPILAHRGPDDFGAWREDGAELFHWRLSILDLSSAGHQPMISRDGRFVICYNGEVYNSGELRRESDAAWNRTAHDASSTDVRVAGGGRWRGHSDTEVVLEGFARCGSSILDRLNGMFALAVYDRQDRTMWLARDRMGIKPLYIWENGELLLFASEPKFFFVHPSFSGAVNSDGLAAFFTYGHSTGRWRMLQGVRQLEPGETLRVKCGEPPRSDRFCVRPAWRAREWTDEKAVREVRAILERVVQRQLVSDVPVGVLLSGGVDSSILTLLTARILGPSSTQTFTLVYPEFGEDFNELEEARAMARHLGVQHHVVEASTTDAIEGIEKMVWQYDEPFADAAAVNVLLLSRLIRNHVTVALAGEGSDELFGGYRRYQVEQWFRRFAVPAALLSAAFRWANLQRVPYLPRRLQIVLRSMSQRSAGARYSAYFESGVNLLELIRPEWRSTIDLRETLELLYPDTLGCPPIAALCLADQQWWLPDTYLEKSDKGSMAQSLELRVPFLDNEVVEFANSLPDRLRVRGRSGKWLLKEAFRNQVPPGVFGRFKRGFAVPLSQWFRGELADYFEGRVLSASSRSALYLDVATLNRLHAEHRRGECDHANVLWQALIFEIWLGHLHRCFTAPETVPRRTVDFARG